MNARRWLRAREACRRGLRASVVTASLLGSLATAAGAQPELRVPPLLDGHLLVGGEFSATYGTRDEGFYNHTDYNVSLLRYLVGQIDAEWVLGSRASLVGELRSENDHGVRASAWFLRVRPVAATPLSLEIGRVSHVFGQATNRRYGNDSLLIGLPLAYQYLTSLRYDSLPAHADALLRSRGRGWLLTYPAGVGNPLAEAGLPIVAALRYDTEVKLAWNVGGRLEAAGAVTLGSLSRPLADEDNGRRQVAARVVARPSPALAFGVSAARGAYVDDEAKGAVAQATAATTREWYQAAFGIDAEWSAGHWLARGEVIASRWEVPQVAAPRLPSHLDATTSMLEGRYRVHPRGWVALRAEHLRFSKIVGTVFAGRPTTWDGPVTRVEGGVGVVLTRQLTWKVAYQHAWRDAGRVRSPHLAATQLSFWF